MQKLGYYPELGRLHRLVPLAKWMPTTVEPASAGVAVELRLPA